MRKREESGKPEVWGPPSTKMGMWSWAVWRAGERDGNGVFQEEGTACPVEGWGAILSAGCSWPEAVRWGLPFRGVPPRGPGPTDSGSGRRAGAGVPAACGLGVSAPHSPSLRPGLPSGERALLPFPTEVVGSPRLGRLPPGRGTDPRRGGWVLTSGLTAAGTERGPPAPAPPGPPEDDPSRSRDPHPQGQPPRLLRVPQSPFPRSSAPPLRFLPAGRGELRARGALGAEDPFPARGRARQPVPRQLPWRRFVLTTSASVFPSLLRFSLSGSSPASQPPLHCSVSRSHAPRPRAPPIPAPPSPSVSTSPGGP